MMTECILAITQPGSTFLAPERMVVRPNESTGVISLFPEGGVTFVACASDRGVRDLQEVASVAQVCQDSELRCARSGLVAGSARRNAGSRSRKLRPIGAMVMFLPPTAPMCEDELTARPRCGTTGRSIRQSLDALRALLSSRHRR